MNDTKKEISSRSKLIALKAYLITKVMKWTSQEYKMNLGGALYKPKGLSLEFSTQYVFQYHQQTFQDLMKYCPM